MLSLITDIAGLMMLLTRDILSEVAEALRVPSAELAESAEEASLLLLS
jgi:hypothetical protein